MKRFATLASVLCLTAILSTKGDVYSHCEIPCGIYGDLARIHILNEDIKTVEKSMKQIDALSKESPVNANQLIRWVNNKEEHCNKIQHIVTQYWMTQRIKPTGADHKDHKKYIGQITTAHGLLLSAMKCKQTTDLAHVKALRDGVKKLSKLYFSKEDLEHLKGHH